LIDIVEFDQSQVEAFLSFAADLPAGDRTFIKEPIDDPETVHGWARKGDSDGATRWLAVDGDTVAGFLAVLRLPDWSDHVGEIRLVVHPDFRGRGIGRALARKALVHAALAGLAKLVVEIVADHEDQLAMFTAIGFTGEALLRDQIRGPDGRLRDLVMLAHFLDATWSDMDALGLSAELVPDLD
jgi:ribosomal protein S18 acetylase RimI-like enzyme